MVTAVENVERQWDGAYRELNRKPGSMLSKNLEESWSAKLRQAEAYARIKKLFRK